MGKPITTIEHLGEGHDDYEDTKVIEGSDNVFSNNLGVCRKGDHLKEHDHPRITKSGSKSVFVNSKECIRKGDPIEGEPGADECSGKLLEGNENVLIGD